MLPVGKNQASRVSIKNKSWKGAGRVRSGAKAVGPHNCGPNTELDVTLPEEATELGSAKQTKRG